MLRYLRGALESAMTFEIEDGRIARIYVQRNPEKLRRIAARQSFALG
jgi:RNA polymerase sigma-70 factor (ECF subfamily)